MFSANWPSPDDPVTKRRVYGTAIAALEKELRAAEARVEKLSLARMNLPTRSRARVTTANARLSTACEARDNIRAALDYARAAFQATLEARK